MRVLVTTLSEAENLLPLLLDAKRAEPVRDALVSESSSGVLAIRQGEWKLIPQLGSGGFTKPAKMNCGRPAAA